MPMPSIPAAESFVLSHVTVPRAVMAGDQATGLQRVDLLIQDGIIASVGEPGSLAGGEGRVVIDWRDGLALPAFVDVHTHLDKGQIWPRRPNPDGRWMSALEAVSADREKNWSAGDVRRRMEFSLRSALAHGTAAIRTHLDSAPPQTDITWAVFEEVRADWAGRIELQGVSLLGPDHLLDRDTLRSVAGRTLAAGGVLGGAIGDHPQVRQAMRNAVEVADEFGLDLDIHCDETSSLSAAALISLAEAIIETGYPGRALAGHCCALALQDAETVRWTTEKVAEAGIAVVSLPMCNMYLQDRDNSNFAGATTPRWRGVAPLNELKAAGVPVAIASDNTRDPFYAYGDLDCVEVLREGARILHFDHPAEQAWNWARAVGADPAAFCGFAHGALIETGAPADLVLFDARDWTELLARPQADRVVLRAGRAIDRTLPDFRELDDLMG
jgi:cytosine deaminase